jgi:hypothetical protein
VLPAALLALQEEPGRTRCPNDPAFSPPLPPFFDSTTLGRQFRWRTLRKPTAHRNAFPLNVAATGTIKCSVLLCNQCLRFRCRDSQTPAQHL